MKKIICLVMLLAMMLALGGCSCKHVWVDATCTTPKTCSECAETEGEALGHVWKDATCTVPKTCSVCAATEGETLEHAWEEATCTAPQTCADCGETQGEPIPHTLVLQNLNETTRTELCTVCSETVTAAVTDLAAESMELLVGTWNAGNIYNGIEVSPVEEPFFFEFRPDGTVVSQLPDNPGEGTCTYDSYNAWLEMFRFKVEINGKTYDIALQTAKVDELQWWYRDRYAAYICAKE